MIYIDAPLDTRAIGSNALQLDMTGELAYVVDAKFGWLHIEVELAAIGVAQDIGMRRIFGAGLPAYDGAVDGVLQSTQLTVVAGRQEIEADEIFNGSRLAVVGGPMQFSAIGASHSEAARNGWMNDGADLHDRAAGENENQRRADHCSCFHDCTNFQQTGFIFQFG
jgi:hypothetical protein